MSVNGIISLFTLKGITLYTANPLLTNNQDANFHTRKHTFKILANILVDGNTNTNHISKWALTHLPTSWRGPSWQPQLCPPRWTRSGTGRLGSREAQKVEGMARRGSLHRQTNAPICKETERVEEGPLWIPSCATWKTYIPGEQKGNGDSFVQGMLSAHAQRLCLFYDL